MWIVVIVAVWALVYVVASVGAWYTETDTYKRKKKTERYDSYRTAADRMMSTQFYKDLIAEIDRRERAYYAEHIERYVEYNNKITSDTVPCVFPVLLIGKTKVGYEGKEISFSQLGYKDLTDEQVQALGVALIKSGRFVGSSLDSGFARVDANRKYWEIYIQRKIEEVYNRKRSEFNRTHKDVF